MPRRLLLGLGVEFKTATRHKDSQKQARRCVGGRAGDPDAVDTGRVEKEQEEEGRESPLPQGVPDSVQVLSLSSYRGIARFGQQIQKRKKKKIIKRKKEIRSQKRTKYLWRSPTGRPAGSPHWLVGKNKQKQKKQSAPGDKEKNVQGLAVT